MILVLSIVFALSLFVICVYRNAANTAQFHEAIVHFDQSRLRSLLAKGNDVNQLNQGDVFGIRIRSYPLPYDSDVTPIYVAAGESNIDAVRLLLENGANPNLGSAGYSSPLELAVMQLAPSINIHAFDPELARSNSDPSIRASRVEIIRLLIAYGADINQRRFDGAESPLETCERIDEPTVHDLMVQWFDERQKRGSQ
jgi:hypothetical protein